MSFAPTPAAPAPPPPPPSSPTFASSTVQGSKNAAESAAAAAAGGYGFDSTVKTGPQGAPTPTTAPSGAKQLLGQ